MSRCGYLQRITVKVDKHELGVIAFEANYLNKLDQIANEISSAKSWKEVEILVDGMVHVYEDETYVEATAVLIVDREGGCAAYAYVKDVLLDSDWVFVEEAQTALLDEAEPFTDRLLEKIKVEGESLKSLIQKKN